MYICRWCLFQFSGDQPWRRRVTVAYVCCCTAFHTTTDQSAWENGGSNPTGEWRLGGYINGFHFLLEFGSGIWEDGLVSYTFPQYLLPTTTCELKTLKINRQIFMDIPLCGGVRGVRCEERVLVRGTRYEVRGAFRLSTV